MTAHNAGMIRILYSNFYLTVVYATQAILEEKSIFSAISVVRIVRTVSKIKIIVQDVMKMNIIRLNRSIEIILFVNVNPATLMIIKNVCDAISLATHVMEPLNLHAMIAIFKNTEFMLTQDSATAWMDMLK
jgi:hypothetical protein